MERTDPWRAERLRRLVPHAVTVVGRFARKRRRGVVAVALLSFVAGLLEAASLVLLARVAAAVNDGDERLGVLRGIELSRTSALALAAGLVMLKLACNVAVARRSARLATWALTEARRRLLAGFFESSFERQSEDRLGDLQELMTTHVDRVASATLQLTVLISAILSMGTLVVVALAVNPAAAGLIAIAVFGLSLLLRPVAAAARRIGRLQSAAGRTFASAVTETVAVAREARVFGVADRLLDRVMRESRTQAGLYQRSRALFQIAGPLYQSVAMLALIGALALVATGEGIVLADLGAIVLLLLRAFSYGQQAQSALHQLNDFAPYLEDVAAKEHQYHAAAETPGLRRVERIGRVELDAVSFNYTGAPKVLRDVSVVFGPGETVGVIGPSGSGKSTLLQLLLRLREPVRGELRVDGEPANAVSLQSWYERVAFVPQEGRLLRGTVSENVTFLRPGDDALVERAARLAHVHDEIVAMPDGYGTTLAPGTLSGGQIQRICIARALYTDPDLLLLDEPTSALDALSEQRIRETLESLHGDHTIVIVAHRITTLSMCDRILVLEGGEVAALGDHDSLLVRSAFYEEAIRLSTLPQ